MPTLSQPNLASGYHAKAIAFALMRHDQMLWRLAFSGAFSPLAKTHPKISARTHLANQGIPYVIVTVGGAWLWCIWRPLVR